MSWWFGRPEDDEEWLSDGLGLAEKDALGDEDFPDLDFGACCACGSRVHVRNFILLPFRTPVPGTGWGCATCGLPADGALSVVCDDCAGKGGEIDLKYMVVGFVSEQMRCEIDCDMEPFEHDAGNHGYGPAIDGFDIAGLREGLDGKRGYRD